MATVYATCSLICDVEISERGGLRVKDIINEFSKRCEDVNNK
jgi:hypothetical protein